MNPSRIALIAAVGWTLKSVAIGTAGGLDKSPFEGPLFFVGLGCYLVAVLALGVAVTRRLPGWVRAAVGVLAVVVGIVVVSVIGAVVNAIEAPSAERHWAWTEVNLWVMAIGALVLALAVRERHTDRSSGAATPGRGLHLGTGHLPG